MNTEQLTTLVLKALDDLKGKDILSMDVTPHCDFTDAMVFCTGTSNRHVKSLSNAVVDAVKNQNQRPLGVEGEETGEWILIDLGSVVVHIMQAAVRNFYQIESLWAIKPDNRDN